MDTRRKCEILARSLLFIRGDYIPPAECIGTDVGARPGEPAVVVFVVGTAIHESGDTEDAALNRMAVRLRDMVRNRHVQYQGERADAVARLARRDAFLASLVAALDATEE